jgi:enamine deaminase RidA (YjgF/YER057c/UK114 family)
LKASGTGKERLLKVNVFLRNIDVGADDFNAVWDEWISKDHLPVRTTIEAKLMRPELLVEVDCIAALLP